METQYDVIVIGSGEAGQSAIEALRQYGKTALLIDLKPDMLTTMVCQTPQHPSSNSQPASYNLDPIFIGDEQSHIVLQKQVFNTPTTKTTTYTLHAHEAMDMRGEGVYSPFDTISPNPNPNPFSFPTHENEHYTGEMHNNLGAPFQNQPFSLGTERPLYDEMYGENGWGMPNSSYFEGMGDPEFQLPPVSSPFEQPYLNQETQIRNPMNGGNQTGYQPNEMPFGEPSPYFDTQPPQAQPFSSMPFSGQNDYEQLEQTDPFAMEPLGSRRRARSSKKGRFGEMDPYEQESTQQPGPMFWEGGPFQQQAPSTFGEPLFENRAPTLQPFQRVATPPAPPVPPPLPSQVQTSPPAPQPVRSAQPSPPPRPIRVEENENLKRDNIQFEEVYGGGYSNWEENLSPQNSRKRPEMDKVEKRKIALRGMNNLINNLG